jgi:hypothetical protein
MSFSLADVKKTRRTLPPRTVIYGPHKVGKSTFAAGSPSPVFVQTEDGLDSIDTSAFPLAHSWADVLDSVKALYSDDHDYKTIILDSGDWAEKLCRAAVAKEHGFDGIEGIGYGKGYTYTAEKFAELLHGLNTIRLQRDIGIVIICHSEIKKYDDPLGESYDRHQIKMHKDLSKMVQEWADVIGFAQIEKITKGEKKGFTGEKFRAIGTGRHVLSLGNNPAFDAGNRYGLPQSISLDWAEYAAAIEAA